MLIQFTQATNIGLNVAVYLAQQEKGQNVSMKVLARRFAVSPTYLSKIMTRLVKAGLTRANPGVKGGYQLAQAGDEITFAMVIDALAGRPQIDDPLDDTGNHCEIAATIQTAEDAMWQVLQAKRISDVTII